MIRILAVLVIVSALAGCQTNSHQTQAHAEQSRVSQQLSVSLAQNNTCFEAIKKNDSVKRVFTELTYQNNESTNKLSLITNSLPPTQEQIEILKSALPHLTTCRASMINGTSGTPYQIAVLKLYNAIDAMYIKLLKAEITIGAANEAKSQAIAEYNVDWATATSEFNNRLSQMYNSEMEGRRQTAAAMMPYLLQQQQNFQSQQQLMYQQQMQSIINNRPIITPPSRTNCTRYGNQIDCVTQ